MDRKLKITKSLLVFTMVISAILSVKSQFWKKQCNHLEYKFDTIAIINDSTTYLEVKRIVDNQIAETARMFFVERSVDTIKRGRVVSKYYKTINHGRTVVYHKSTAAKFAEGSYTEGKSNNDWTYWDEDGSALDAALYKRNKGSIRGEGFYVFEVIKERRRGCFFKKAGSF